MKFIQLKITTTFLVVLLLLISCKHQEQIVKAVVETPPKEIVIPPKIDNIMSEYLELKYPNISNQKYVYISIKYQQLFLIENDSTTKHFPISTATNGMGTKTNSYKTPYGLHTIKNKIGDNVPYAGIFESRVYYGNKATILTDNQNSNKDYVTTRILWLQGEDYGINKGGKVDSYNRYIYIHGTPEEGLIGQPASHGCIRMKNKDVIELFKLLDLGTPIYILES